MSENDAPIDLCLEVLRRLEKAGVLRGQMNGELRQQGNTRDLIWKLPELVEFISSFMTLDPGDVILTGTPKGLSHVYPGDVMRLEVDGLGALENPVVAESQQ